MSLPVLIVGGLAIIVGYWKLLMALERLAERLEEQMQPEEYE